MDKTSAEKELNRIERELDAKEQPPGKPPSKQGGWVGGNDEKPKNQSLDAVVVGALLRLKTVIAELGDHLKNFHAKPNNARTNDPQAMRLEGPQP